jgi:hypothetical protein
MPIGNPFKDLPKPVIIGGIVIAVGTTGILLYKHHAATGSWFGGTAAASAPGSAIDPVTGLPTSQDNAIDPATGQAYLAEAQEYGSVSAAEAAVSSYGTTTDSGTGTSTAFGTDGTTTTAAGAVSASTYTSNAAWDQAAIAGLEDISGGSTYNGVDIASTLGAVLQGTPITSAQLQVWNAAVGEFGQPPTPVSPVILPASTASATTKKAVPRITGENVREAGELLSYAGFKSAFTGNEGDPQNVWIVKSQTPAAGTPAVTGTTVTGVAEKPPATKK